MNVLITGGTGLIGTALSESLVRDGHHVWVLTRSPRTARVPAGVQAAGWDGKTSQGWGGLVETMDAIVNLAGENIGALPWTNARKESIRCSRVESGKAVVQAVSEAARRPRVLVQSSAVGYYGVHGDEALTEKSPHGEDYLSSIGVDWEASTQPVEALGVRRAVARTGVVLSMKEGALPRFLYPFRLYAGGPMGSGHQWISWIHVEDEVNALRFLIDREDVIGPVNLTAPEPVTNAEFGRALADVLHRPYWLPAPAFALKALLGEMSTVVLDGQYVLPEKLLAMGFPFKYDRLRPALENLLNQQ